MKKYKQVTRIYPNDSEQVRKFKNKILMREWELKGDVRLNRDNEEACLRICRRCKCFVKRNEKDHVSMNEMCLLNKFISFFNIVRYLSMEKFYELFVVKNGVIPGCFVEKKRGLRL